jgi:hypothetical protein
MLQFDALRLENLETTLFAVVFTSIDADVDAADEP